jgi:SAM-dependent methyltransferase
MERGGPTEAQILAENVRVHATEAGSYDEMHRDIFNRLEQRRLEADLDRFCAGRAAALDLGAGTGNIALKLAARGLDVTAVDLSPEMLSRLEARAPERITAEASDADSFLDGRDELPELVTMSSVLHHLPAPWRTLERICSLLPTGGLLYMTHEPTGIPLPPVQRGLDLAERVAWSALHPRLAREARSIDYSVSDHHAQEGFAPDRMRGFLAAHDMEVELLRTYGRSKFAALARVSTALGNRVALTVAARRT